MIGNFELSTSQYIWIQRKQSMTSASISVSHNLAAGFQRSGLSMTMKIAKYTLDALLITYLCGQLFCGHVVF